jgi:hypothetical protein
MKTLFIFPSFFILATALKTPTNQFNVPVTTVKGDLNKDKIPDLVVVTQDTLDDKAPYKLDVFFCSKDGKKKCVLSSTTALEPGFPNGRSGHKTYGMGSGHPTIVNGVLWINYGLIRGHIEHKFRFQDGNFELIGYSYGESDGQGTITVIDFNLSTGMRLYTKTDYHTDEVLVSKKEKKLIRPPPKTSGFCTV